VKIFIKNPEQLDIMRAAGKIAAETLALLEKNITVGVTTGELDRLADAYIRSQGAAPSFLNYNGFPASVCISLNEQVIHGVPGIRRLKSGDIVGIDVGACLRGFHADAARTFPVGEITDEHKRLIAVTEESFFKGIEFARKDCFLHQICAAIGFHAERNGFSVVRGYTGHGVGRKLHEDPQIPNFKLPTRGPRLSQGMTLAIEPMVNAGKADIKILEDGWTVVTKDGKYSSHYENTVVITDNGPEIITLI